jgi:glutamine amidotransferase-like uncharacterized protein
MSGRILPFLALFIFCSAARASGRPADTVLVYRGPGACAGCPEAVGEVLKAMGRKVQYVKPGMLTEKNFSRALLYVQPGGSDRVLDTLEALSKAETDNLRKFVLGGGRYLGICAGGYLAGDRTDDDDGRLVPAFGLLPSVIDQESNNNEPDVMEITWQGADRKVYYQAGPWFDPSQFPGARSFGTYKASGHSMALIVKTGLGKTGVIGPHLEATDDWFIEDHLPVPERSGVPLLKDFIRELVD